MNQPPEQPASNDHLLYGLLGLLLSVLSLLLYYWVSHVQNPNITLMMVLQNPLSLAIAAVCARIGGDVGVFIVSRKTRIATTQQKTESSRITFWMFSTYMTLSLLQLIANGGVIKVI